MFACFDPLDGEAPDWPFCGVLPNIVERARALLRSRSREEIENVVDFIDYAIDEYIDEENAYKKEHWIDEHLRDPRNYGDDYCSACAEFDAIRDALVQSGWILDRGKESDVALFRQCNFELPLDDADFKNGKVYEYFAALALWKVAEAILWLKPARGESNFHWAGTDAIEAMEAVCYAEHLELVQRVRLEGQHANDKIESLAEKRASEHVSARNKRAANIRHAKTTRKVKEFVVGLYLKERETFKSPREAAGVLLGDAVDYAKSLGERNLLQGTSAFNKVYEWLREAEKKYKGRVQP